MDINALFDYSEDKNEDAKALNVFIEGGIGDNAITVSWIEAFKDFIEPNQPINLYSRHPKFLKICCPWADVKSNIKFDRDFVNMDFAIIVTDMVVFRLNVDRLNMTPKMAIIFQKYLNSLKSFGQFFARFPRTAPMFSAAAVAAGMKRYDFIFKQVDLPFSDFKYECDRPKDMPEKCLLINDGFAAWHKIARATKCWDLGNWDSFLREFKISHPDITTVQIGGENSVPLRTDINLISKTTLTEMIAWTLHAQYYVGNDSGPTHIRHWSKKPSVVLFGPSPEAYYGYPENINLSTNGCQPCYWQIDEWNEICKLGRATCLRLSEITSEKVMEALGGVINDNKG